MSQTEIESLPKVSPDAIALLRRIAKYNDYGTRFQAGAGKRGVGRPVYASPLYELERAGFVLCCLDSADLTATGATLAAYLCS